MARAFHNAVIGSLLMCVAAAAGPVSLSLTPTGGTVSGPPDSTVGWGFSLTNGSAEFLLVANSYFCGPGQDPLFTTCTQALGTYNDFIASNATLIAPGDTVDQSFDAGASQGFGEYAISGSALPGQVDSGSLVLVYDLFTANPFDPNSGAVQDGGDIELPVEGAVDVTGNVSAVPEPASSTLLLTVLAGTAGFLRRRALRRRRLSSAGRSPGQAVY